MLENSNENSIINNSSCNNKKHLKSLFLINNGNISKTLEDIIKKQCDINSLNCFFGIFNGFIGNFSVKDMNKDNIKKRITITDNVKISPNYRKDNNIYILNIFKYKDGVLIMKLEKFWIY